jgi:tartrate dehydrogenase/decarboxylase/D-malate dehydrogenase
VRFLPGVRSPLRKADRERAGRLHTAIEATTAAGILTRDLGGTASTKDVTRALIGALDS